MLYLTHHDDKKGTYQSHTIGFKYIKDGKIEVPVHVNSFGASIAGTDITTLNSYGATKDESLKGVGNLLDWLLDEITALKTLYDNGYYIDNMIELDDEGQPIIPNTDKK